MSAYHKQYALPVGKLVQEYRIIEVLGSGGFGIVYKAENKYFSEIVALKEFLPLNLAYRDTKNSKIFPLSPETEKAYRWTRHKFLQEAKTLRELGYPHQHPNIVKVRQFIEANDTAYMVMDFEEGQPLSEILSKQGALTEEKIKSILDALLDGLDRVHKAAVLHRDIKPSNILIRSDGSPVLIDFGAARRDISGASQSIITTISPAYAAVEQAFPIGRQGPWTDIYALGATLYHVVTGRLPISASDRMQGKAYVPAAVEEKQRYSACFLSAIDAALELYPKDRPQSISQWKTYFTSQETAKVLPSAPMPLNEAYDDKTVINTATKNPGWIDLLKPIIYPQRIFKFYLLFAVIVSICVLGIGLNISRRSFFSDASHDSPIVTKKIFPPQNRVSLPHTQLSIKSFPAGARVFINGEFKGKTPVTTGVDAGVQSLYLGLQGYYDWKANLLVKEKEEIPIRISLLKK